MIRGGWRAWLFVFLQAASASATEELPAALQRRLQEVQALAPAGFTVLIQPPFIVAGDEPAAMVRTRAMSTVSWAVDRLKKDFFAKDPEEIIAIWLFKNEESYTTNTRRLFQMIPPARYGFYSAQHQALIMNIGTGGGTLIHEIVHPFIRTNFPACPAWFNEGLGSLFEQCEDRAGHIHGLTNWRLGGLQEAIRLGKTIPFETLTSMTDTEFYGDPAGYNQHYGQARYLCYYLQEHGLLVRFYHEYAAHRHEDPAGFQSLKKVLGTEDLAGFQKHWEQYVLKLHFP